MEKKKTYLIRVHEKEFKQIKENSPLLRRLLRWQKKRQKYYERVEKNAAKNRAEEIAWRDRRMKQVAAAQQLVELIKSRRQNAEHIAVNTSPPWHHHNCVSLWDAKNKLLDHTPNGSFDYPRGRAYYIMRSIGITCVFDFRLFTAKELENIPGIGRTTVNNFVKDLRTCGIELGDLVPHIKPTPQQPEKDLCQQKKKTQQRPKKTQQSSRLRASCVRRWARSSCRSRG